MDRFLPRIAAARRCVAGQDIIGRVAAASKSESHTFTLRRSIDWPVDGLIG
ncbi:MAG: hypothetical protein WD928_13585 [Gammaproteobacteria bacterium]